MDKFWSNINVHSTQTCTFYHNEWMQINDDILQYSYLRSFFTYKYTSYELKSHIQVICHVVYDAPVCSIIRLLYTCFNLSLRSNLNDGMVKCSNMACLVYCNLNYLFPLFMFLYNYPFLSHYQSNIWNIMWICFMYQDQHCIYKNGVLSSIDSYVI